MSRPRPHYLMAIFAVAVEIAAALVWLAWRRRHRHPAAISEPAQ